MGQEAFRRPAWIGLRTRLWLVMLIVLLPGLTYLVVSSVLERQRARAQAQAELVSLAKLAAAEEQVSIDHVHSQLALVAALPAVQTAAQNGPTDPCTTQLSNLAAAGHVAVWNSAGTLICSSPEGATASSAALTKWYQGAVASRDFTIGDFELDPSTGTSVLLVAYPILNNDQLLGVVSARLDLAQLTQTSAVITLPDDAVLTVFDANGVVLARSAQAATWAGKRLPDPNNLASALASGSNVMAHTDVDGAARLTAFAPIVGPGGNMVYLGIGRPAAAVNDSANTTLAVGLVLTLVLTLLAVLLAAWWGRQTLVRPMQGLLAVADRLAGGDLTARAPAEAAGSEVDRLAGAVNQMAGQLAQGEQQRQQNEARLRDLDGQLRHSQARATQLEAVAAGLSRAGTPAEVLEVVLRQGASAIGAASASVLLLSADGLRLKRAAHAGQADPMDRLFQQYPVSSPLPAADVVRTGETIWIDSAAAFRARYPQLTDVINSTDYEAAVAVPLRVAGRLIGVLLLNFPAELSTSSEIATFVARLAGLCALGLERARLLAETQPAPPTEQNI